MSSIFAGSEAVTATHLRANMRSVGFWMAAGMMVLQGFYALEAFIDPVGLAAYRGTPLVGGSVTWVQAYGSRTLFVALLVFLLLIRDELALLKWVALIGLVMPVSDALTTWQAQAPRIVVIRHVATAGYLLAVFVLLSRWLKERS